VDGVGEIAHSALAKGMVYFCVWGPDCGRFHDIVDETVTLDEIGERRFAAPNRHDTIMTTNHSMKLLISSSTGATRMAAFKLGAITG